MNKRNLILTVLGTLLLGFVLGFFISGRMTYASMAHKHKVMNSPIAEKERLANRLDFTATQTQLIYPILDTLLPQQIQLFKIHRGQMDALRDSMFTAIAPLLDASQLKEVNKMKKRRRPNGPPL